MTTWTRGIGPRVAHDPGDPLITSHCPFCGSGQVVGRSDGTIGCDFCGQAYIVRVQPAFPGMPQMPGSPGAPSDVGPDGGVVDPGMVGPDGMPMDDGPPGDDEGAPPLGGDDGGPPPGAGGDGDDDAPPPPGKGDDSKKPPKSKGDSKKKPKEGARRTAGYPRYTPHEREVLPLHMTSHHGWSPAEVREAMEWPEAVNVLPGHHDADHAQYHTAIQSLHVPHAHDDLSHGEAGPPWQPPSVPDTPEGLSAHGRRYRGLHGEPLTEGQLIRHMAAALSGNHPSVLARLRAEASLAPRAAHSGEYVPVGSSAELRAHMRQGHGLNPDMMDDAIAAKLHDRDHAQRDYGWEGSPDAAHSPGFVAARGTR